jgi:hypothetical protein
VLTTLYSHGDVGRERQAEIISTLTLATESIKNSGSELSKILAKALV